MDLKKEAIGAGAGIFYALLMWFIIWKFQPNYYELFALLMAGSCILMLAMGTFKWKSLGKSAIYIVGFLAAFHYLRAWSFLLTILVVPSLIIYRRWDKFLEVKHHIESMVWGKPLKDFEGKPPKVKFGKKE